MPFASVSRYPPLPSALSVPVSPGCEKYAPAWRESGWKSRRDPAAPVIVTDPSVATTADDCHGVVHPSPNGPVTNRPSIVDANARLKLSESAPGVASESSTDDARYGP